MNRALASRFMSLRRTLIQKRNRSGHHDVVNCGPPATLGLMPIPFQSYGKVYNELQSKFNTYLIGASAFFVVSFGYALYEDVFCFEAVRPPKSYRNRSNKL